MKRMGWIAAALLGVVLMASVAEAAVWNVLQNGDCTGFAAATVNAQGTVSATCCFGTRQGFCNRRMNYGDLFEVVVTLVGGGGGTGTNVGDVISSTEFAKVGLSQVVDIQCEMVGNNANPSAASFLPIVRRASLNASCTGSATPYSCCTGAAAGTCTGTPAITLRVPNTDVAASGAANAGVTLRCMVFGY